MTTTHIAQLAAGLLAAATPWIVVRVAHAIAGRSVESRYPLAHLTIASVMAVGAAAIILPESSLWMALVGLTAFACLSVPAYLALGQLDSATEATRTIESSNRAATLVARRHHQYLPWLWRIALYSVAAAGAALFVWRTTTLDTRSNRILPIVFAAIAVVFLLLYEAWIHGLVTRPVVSAERTDESLRTSVRRVFAVESVLVTSFLGLANALLVPLIALGGWLALLCIAGGALGVIGCALALSSDLTSRQYRTVR